MTMTALGTSVLALLCEKPMHPYEMYRLMLDRHEDRIVKVRPGSLYHTVARLADKSLVEADGPRRAGGRPEHTTYRAPPAGRAAVRAPSVELQTDVDKAAPLIAAATTRTHEAHLLDSLYLIEMARAEIGWLTRLIERLETKELTWPSEDRL